ncbi:MAG: hypothetical protein RJA70_1461 [Pseudomonadota bacterium]|jgi:hypothetical protein
MARRCFKRPSDARRGASRERQAEARTLVSGRLVKEHALGVRPNLSGGLPRMLPFAFPRLRWLQ